MFRKLAVLLMICVFMLSACVLPSGSAGPDEPSSNETPPSGEAPASPLDPIPGEENMSRGEATVTESDMLQLESYPLQIMLNLKGTLPTPCHHLRAEVKEPDDQNRIMVDVFTVYDPTEICVQMIEEFETSLPLGSFPDGSYTVWVNGEQVGEFSQ